MVRFIANNHPSDEGRIVEWSKRLKDWFDRGIEEVYFFVHMHEAAIDLEVAKQVIDQFNTGCNAKLAPLLLNG